MAAPQVPVHLRGLAGVAVRQQDDPVQGKLPCVRQKTRKRNPHMPADPLQPLPPGFTPWDAPYPFQGKGNWDSPFVPRLRANEARNFDRIIQELRQGHSLGFDKHADTQWELGLTTALNAMNSAIDYNARSKPWAYFAPITVVPDSTAANNKPSPGITLPPRIYSDIDVPWTTAHLPIPFRDAANLPRYRYVVFIHRHKARGAPDYSNPIYTMSVWDREHSRMDWFDTQSHEQWREDDILNFWEKVDTNFPAGPNNTEPPGPDTLYINNLPLTTNLYELGWGSQPSQGATLWTILGLALECASPMELCNGEPIFQKGDEYSHHDRWSTAGGMGQRQIPSWYCQLVRMLYVNRKDDAMPPGLKTALDKMGNYRQNYCYPSNAQLRNAIDEVRGTFTGTDKSGKLTKARSEHLVQPYP